MTDSLRTVRRAQGVYYVATGLWPVVAVRHYMAATGQESHPWAARILGGVVVVVGVALAAELVPASLAKRVSLATAALLATGAAYFAIRGKGVAVNSVDGALQVAFAIAAARS